MSFWHEPELPPAQKMPKRRKSVGDRAGWGPRVFVGVIGVALVISGGIGGYRALQDKTGTQSPIGALAVLVPAVVMLRYAATGRLKSL